MNIADFVLEHANTDYFLPSIQREFVWFENPKEQKVEKLFDSLLQEYPIGNLLIWILNKKKDEKLLFEVYNFIESWDEDNPHNKEASLNGRLTIHLVLDGQQRLSSLLIGLRGKRIYTKWGRMRTEKLYINLFSDIENEKNNIYGFKYELSFLEDWDVNYKNKEKKEFWVEVGKVLDYKAETAEDFKEAFAKALEEKVSGNTELIKKAKNTLGQIYKVFCDKDNLIESTVEKKDDEQVLDIFVRINQGGTPLEKADMLLSFMESDKSLFKPEGARKEILAFVDELNKEEVDRPYYGLDQDFVLKAALVLTDLDIQYKLKNFNKENLKKISDKWLEIKKYLILTTKLLGYYKFSEKNIISKNALIPMSYYFMHNGIGSELVYSTNKKDMEVKNSMIRWLAIASLEGLFGSSSDTTLGQIRTKIKDAKQLEETLEYLLTKEKIREIVAKAKYEKPLTRLILMLVIEQKYWVFQEDHLFAREYFDENYLKTTLKLTQEQITDFKYYEDTIGNLQMLAPTINIKKSAEGFIEWNNKQNEDYSKAFLIPKLSDYAFSNFIEFVKAREELISEKLYELLSSK